MNSAYCHWAAAFCAVGMVILMSGCAKQGESHPSPGKTAEKSSAETSSAKVYVETFDFGTNGWFDVSGVEPFPPKPLNVENGAVVASSPWWVDYNHAPPGGGYLHLIMGLMTNQHWADAAYEAAGTNAFVAGGYPTDFTNAKVTIRSRGELDVRGAAVCLLIQGMVDNICSGWVLTGQPITVTKDWSDQTLTIINDPKQWTCLDSRHDRRQTYGTIDLKTIMSDVNINMYLVLFPLNVVPKDKIDGDPHILRAGADYVVDPSKLPEGWIAIDRVRIEFP